MHARNRISLIFVALLLASIAYSSLPMQAAARTLSQSFVSRLCTTQDALSSRITRNFIDPALCKSPTPKPTLTFSADPLTIPTGTTSTLSWNSTGADTCTASDGWSGSKNLSGTQIVAPTATTTYSLSCSRSGDTVSKSVTIAVKVIPVQTSISISASPSPSAQNIVAGVQGWIFTNIRLDASKSDEDLRLLALPVNFSGNAANLSGCQAWDGTTALNTGSRVVNTITSGGSANMFTFDNPLTVPKAATKSIAIACNLSTSATSSSFYIFGVHSAHTFSITGVTSGNTVIPTVTISNSGQQTVQMGSFALAVDPSSPSYALVAGGSTGVTAGVYKLRATNEPVTLSKLGVILFTGSSTDIALVHIYDGATEVGQATFTGSNVTATSTFTTPVTLAKDTDKLLTIKVDLRGISTSASGREGSLVKVNPLNAEGVGQSSGSTFAINSDGSSVAGIRLVKSYPIFALDTLASTGVADGRLIRFKITTNSAGSVGLHQITFALATSSITGVTNIGLFVYTDSGYSSPVSALTNGQFGSTLCISGCTSDGPTLVFQQGTPLQVPAGATEYFELRGTVSGVVTGSSITTTLKGDNTFDGMEAASAVAGNFIWSPDANSLCTLTDPDWTTAFGLFGLPASGFIQTRGN